MEASSEPSVHFLNLEYFFRLLYDATTGWGGVSIQSDLLTLASQIWLLVTAISIIISIGLLWLFIQSTIRYREAVRLEDARYGTLHPAEAEVERDHSRWDHVRSLIESPHENDWRQAIIEADIMLDDLLSQLGYAGQSVGEKLKAVNPERFQTIRNAWDGHMIRNKIAHEGAAFKLEEHQAHRTVALYETVMREHGEI